MPCDEANGLLPGRGAPGLRPTLPGVGACPAGFGRGAPGVGRVGVAGLGDGATGRGFACACCAGDGDAGRSGAGRSGAGSGFLGAGGAAAATGAGAAGAGVDGAGAGAAGRDTGAADGAGAWSDDLYISLSRRTTGGSMVDEADLTYSPISPSFVRSSLLSIPRSLATSCTRGLATTLLLVQTSRPDQLVGCLAHRWVLIEWS